MTTIDQCAHPQYAIVNGPRTTLAQGRQPTEVCTLCGAVRMNVLTPGPWQLKGKDVPHS